jgi:AcrR family transcriptional regulator
MFAELGAEAVTIRQLAAAVGVSPMTPYRYFKDKEAILAAVRARAFDRHAEALERAFAESAPDQKANAIGQAYIDFALNNPEAYKLMFDITQPNEGDYPDLVRAGERSRRTMTLHLEAPGADPTLSAAESALIAHMYWAALHGPLMLHFAGKLPRAGDARLVIGALLATLDHGLRQGGRALLPGLSDGAERLSRPC